MKWPIGIPLFRQTFLCIKHSLSNVLCLVQMNTALRVLLVEKPEQYITVLFLGMNQLGKKERPLSWKCFHSYVASERLSDALTHQLYMF